MTAQDTASEGASAISRLAARLIIVVVFAGWVVATAAATATAEPRSVLLIYGEARLVPAIVAIDQAVRRTFESASAEPTRFYTEYLDLSWLSADDSGHDALHFLRRKYAGRPLDLIMVCGDGAIRLVLRERAALFPGVPIVFCRLGSTPIRQSALAPDVAGVAMPVPWAATLQLALRLHPDTERVILVGGRGDSDRDLEMQAREALSGYRGFLRDGAGRTFTTPEALALVASASPAPIYSVSETLIGHGIVGGALVSFDDLGVKAAELGLRVLRGERQLVLWGIGERHLPPASIVRFRSPSAWQLYKWPILGTAVLIALQTVLIAGLLLERRRRKRVQRGLDERLRFESLLAELLSRFAGPASEDVDRLIETSLRRIVEALELDRASLAEFVDGAARLSFTHSATHTGSDAMPSVVPVERFPWTAARLRAGHVVQFTRLDELPPDAVEDREGFRAFGTRSIVIIPLVIGSSVAGAVAFTSVRSERGWPEEFVQRLRLLSEVFASALARQRAEIARRESERHLLLMAETAPSMIWMSGVDGRRTYFNARWQEFTGRTLEQELGHGWPEGVHPEDLVQCLEGYRRAFAAREPFTLEYRLRRGDGEYRWVLDHGRPRVDAGGEFRGYLGSCVDVTEIRAAQHVLLENAALRSAVFSSLHGQLAVVGRDGVILTVNDSWAEDPSRTSVGANYLDVGRRAASAGDADARHALDAIQSVLDGRRPLASLEYSSHTRAGERWFEMIVEPFRRPEGGAIVLHIDITRRRQAEEEARRQRDELAHVLRTTTIGELTASLAHEIYQPLAAILTNAQAARRSLEAASANGELQETLADISEDAKRAALIIKRLRALSRKEKAGLEPVDCNQLARGVASLLRHDLHRKSITITFDLAHSLPPVSADPVQLQQVLLNLLLNAVDAIVAGDGRRRDITVATAPRSVGSVELSVSDTGVGVPESELERIFAPFVTTKREGLGMGLAISRSIVSAHQGRMRATRNPDGGLTVHVELPCQPTSGEPEAAGAELLERT